MTRLAVPSTVAEFAAASGPNQTSSDVAFSPAVKALQSRLGSRRGYARMEQSGGWETEVNPELADFIGELDSFFLATASKDGQPYLQHRGGPKGFLKVLDSRTLAFADFGGNRQYISVGNLSENPRVQLFLMDWARRGRVKIWGEARVVEATGPGRDPALLAKLRDPGYTAGKVERAIVITVTAWDGNCPQHISRRFSEEEVRALLEERDGKIARLEAEAARLRKV